jgi:hypothetical protein
MPSVILAVPALGAGGARRLPCLGLFTLDDFLGRPFDIEAYAA